MGTVPVGLTINTGRLGANWRGFHRITKNHRARRATWARTTAGCQPKAGRAARASSVVRRERVGVRTAPWRPGTNRCQGATAHGSYLERFFMMSRMRSAVSDGVLPTLTPAASRASFLATAVPEEPETMAPAWPMVLPSGAVNPAT